MIISFTFSRQFFFFFFRDIVKILESQFSKGAPCVWRLCLSAMLVLQLVVQGRWLVRRRLYLRIYGYFPVYIWFIRAPIRNDGNRLIVVIVVVVFDTTALENLNLFKATSKFWRCTVHENLATKTKKYRPWEHKVGQIVNGRDSTMRRACELLGPNNHISSCICFYIYIYIEREREDFALKAHTNKLF